MTLNIDLNTKSRRIADVSQDVTPFTKRVEWAQSAVEVFKQLEPGLVTEALASVVETMAHMNAQIALLQHCQPNQEANP